MGRAESNARYKAQLEQRGIKQINVLAPIELHDTIRAIARGEKPAELIKAEAQIVTLEKALEEARAEIAALKSTLESLKRYAKVGRYVLNLDGWRGVVIHGLLPNHIVNGR